jgi:hypothetical protein
MTEEGWQRTDDKLQMTEEGWQRADDKLQMTEDGWQRADDTRLRRRLRRGKERRGGIYQLSFNIDHLSFISYQLSLLIRKVMRIWVIREVVAKCDSPYWGQTLTIHYSYHESSKGQKDRTALPRWNRPCIQEKTTLISYL